MIPTCMDDVTKETVLRCGVYVSGEDTFTGVITPALREVGVLLLELLVPERERKRERERERKKEREREREREIKDILKYKREIYWRERENQKESQKEGERSSVCS